MCRGSQCATHKGATQGCVVRSLTTRKGALDDQAAVFDCWSGPGIGMAVARRFAQEGYQLALLARNTKKLHDYAKELHDEGYTVHTYPTDAADEDSLRQSFYRLHEELEAKTEVLVYNAAALNHAHPSEMIYEDALNDFRVNVLGGGGFGPSRPAAHATATQRHDLVDGRGLCADPISAVCLVGHRQSGHPQLGLRAGG